MRATIVPRTANWGWANGNYKIHRNTYTPKKCVQLMHLELPNLGSEKMSSKKCINTCVNGVQKHMPRLHTENMFRLHTHTHATHFTKKTRKTTT